MAEKVPSGGGSLTVKTKLIELLMGGKFSVQAVVEWSHWWRTWVELAGCEVG